MALRRVLVTGGAGYIGSVLTDLLLQRGYEVVVLDRFFFGDTLRDLAGHPGLHLVRDDIRWFPPEVLRGVDAVCDLAALSNDPAGELDPEKTMAINFRGRVRVARLSREAGVRRYIFASTCSVYGFQDGMLTETAPPNPLTTYALANLEAERHVLPLADRRFAVTVLRQATVYGASRRMRFDLAINGMTLGIVRQGRIPVLRDGRQWRPMVHVRDTARAFLAVLEADADAVSGEVFNVGADDQNFEILPLAERVAAAAGCPFAYEWYGLPDHRSYRVAFGKIARRLGYRTAVTVEEGVREIADGLRSGTLEDGPRTRTVEWYRTLLQWHATLRQVVANGSVL